MPPIARELRALVVSALLAASLSSSCRSRPTDDTVERVEFGVLFGGDIQDRPRIPLVLDPATQELALRVTFRELLARDHLVRWELERPTAQRSLDGGIAYAAEIGEIRAHAGERMAEAKLAFRRGDLPGTWHLRVRVDGLSVLDRSITVTEPPRR